MSDGRRLSPHQRVVLGEIVFGKYVTDRRDSRTLRCLIWRGLIEQEADPPGIIRLPSVYAATAGGRKAMIQ